MEKRSILLAVIIVIAFSLLKYLSGFYIDYEWFRVNEGLPVFWIMFFTKFNVHAIFAGLFIGIFLLNFLLIKILGGKGRLFSQNFLDRIQIPAIGSSRKLLMLIIAGGVLFLGFIMGSTASAYWKEFLMFKNQVPFEGFPVDPVFGKDMGFYVFSLPFYQFLYGWLMSTLFMVTLFSFAFHFLNGGIYQQNFKIEFSLFCRAHLSILLALMVLLYGLSYEVASYELLFSEIGKFFGAGYTAINGKLFAYRAAEVISFLAGALLLFNVFKRSFKLPVLILITIIPVYFILGVIYPAILQRFIVEPNELAKEQPYIKNNIKYTRLAYGIDSVKTIPFKNSKNLTSRDIAKNRDTVESVRLWDWRPLKQTYKQLQELKPYYFFNDVDVDRYTIGKKKIAVNLSARELSIDELSSNSQTWQNSHLIYTHGYGAVMSRVDRITTEGLPYMLIKNIPPKSSVNIDIKTPQIYYGEHKNSYVVTNTAIKPGEFDYPSGDKNKYTTYKGTGGIKLDSVFKRLMAALTFNDINLLISGTITSESRLLIRRNIKEIAEYFTPFLELDGDPYLVISKGKLYWMIDAYSFSNQFPYSTPIRMGQNRFNYIRNSVKIVIDAYKGKIDCYISDKKDPLIKVHAKIFPGIYKSLDKMPEDLKQHIRYPEDIFNVQSHMLLKYHMTDPNVFYNNEDAWHIPTQVYESREERVHSYYMVTTLPNEKRSEFILILPFTPYKKNNMIAFLTAKCDMPDYGELQLYQLPKEKLSYGPMQIEARINQDPEISKQLTLWSQKGSNVIRGNMLAIPIEESIVFIEPLYLKAETSEMPELKQVIVAFDDKIAMDKDLPSALARVFYKGGYTRTSETGEKVSYSLKQLADRAWSHYQRAETSMKSGDWKTYGDELKNLKETLNEMKKVNK